MKRGREAESHSESSKTAESKHAELVYLTGYNNEFESESIPHTLPHITTPKKCPLGLYAEQLNGTAFTVPRHSQRRSWLFRKRPTCVHQPFEAYGGNPFFTGRFDSGTVAKPHQLRWKPFPIPSEPTDFVDGLRTLGGAGSPELKTGIAIHIYAANKDMGNRAMANSDGDLLLVPQLGKMRVQTEFGLMDVAPGEICVIPRGIRFKVLWLRRKDEAEPGFRGYVCEVFNGHYEIPDLGPIGANGLANARDFKAPVAFAEQSNGEDYEIIYKFLGEMFSLTQDHTPFDVVSWRGNYVPYKYDLADFVPVNAVLKDHMDPSIFTVLTCQSQSPGVAVADFVIFPPRYAVQQDTFRPPYYHRNCMTEFMGNIRGSYDARRGFAPGSASLHSCMVGHGPDAETFSQASNAGDTPVLMEDNLAFMFESTYVIRLTSWALQVPRDEDYNQCWDKLQQQFKD